MKRLFCFFLIISSCSSPEKYPIAEASLKLGLCISMLNNIKIQLKSDPKNKALLYKKLFISQQLKWPEDVRSDIQLLIKEAELTPELYTYATDFYNTYGLYEELLSITDKWLSFSDPKPEDMRWRIRALNGLQRYIEAHGFLWEMLQQSNEVENLSFIAQEYLKMQDTVRAMYAFSRLARNRPTEPTLLGQYVFILLSQGYPERARELLLIQKDQIKNYDDRVLFARALFQLGDLAQAFGLIRAYDRPEAFFQLADWYHQLNYWDSAIYYTDKVISLDSSRQALLKKGMILEDKGRLNSALTQYQVLLDKVPGDSIALGRVQNVERKIAYLRKLRKKENQIPVLEISSKKATDNE